MSYQKQRDEGEEEKWIVKQTFGQFTFRIINGHVMEIEGLSFAHKHSFFLDQLPYLQEDFGNNKNTIHIGKHCSVSFSSQKEASKLYNFILDAMVASKNK